MTVLFADEASKPNGTRRRMAFGWIVRRWGSPPFAAGPDGEGIPATGRPLSFLAAVCQKAGPSARARRRARKETEAHGKNR
jgi:hypothetical protein